MNGTGEKKHYMVSSIMLVMLHSTPEQHIIYGMRLRTHTFGALYHNVVFVINNADCVRPGINAQYAAGFMLATRQRNEHSIRYEIAHPPTR